MTLVNHKTTDKFNVSELIVSLQAKFGSYTDSNDLVCSSLHISLYISTLTIQEISVKLHMNLRHVQCVDLNFGQ